MTANYLLNELYVKKYTITEFPEVASIYIYFLAIASYEERISSYTLSGFNWSLTISAAYNWKHNVLCELYNFKNIFVDECYNEEVINRQWWETNRRLVVSISQHVCQK